MVRSVTTFDPDWTDDDLAAALDWAQDDARRCRGCGQPLDETTDPDNWRDYDADIVTCYGCQVGDQADRAYRAQNKDHDGIRCRVFRRPPLPDPHSMGGGNP